MVLTSGILFLTSGFWPYLLTLSDMNSLLWSKLWICQKILHIFINSTATVSPVNIYFWYVNRYCSIQVSVLSMISDNFLSSEIFMCIFQYYESCSSGIKLPGKFKIYFSFVTTLRGTFSNIVLISSYGGHAGVITVASVVW